MDVQEWLREDFRARISEIQNRIGQRQSVVQYGSVAVGGITALVATAYAKEMSLGALLHEWLIPMSLGGAFFFLAFTLMLLRHDLLYIEKVLKPKIKGPSDILTWEKYVCSKRAKYRITHYALALSRIVPMALPCLALLGMGAKAFWDMCPNFVECFTRIGNWPWKIITGTLAGVDIVGLGLLVWSACLVSKEEREITKVAEDSLFHIGVHELVKRIADVEKRVSSMEEKVADLGRRMASLEEKLEQA